MALQWLTHQMILIRSPCRPRNTNMWPLSVNASHSPAGQWLNGFCCVVCSACAASAAKPLRMSGSPAASQARAFNGTGIIPTELCLILGDAGLCWTNRQGFRAWLQGVGRDA